MNLSRKIFVGFVVLFFATLLFLVYDISRKTTFPGAKSKAKQEQERKSKAKMDSLKNTLAPKSPIHQP